MDILVPKYLDRFVRHGNIAMHSGLRGEYRAKLYGADGRIKYDSGWEPNTILNQGLVALSQHSNNPWLAMYLGDSDIVVDVAQTGIQGIPFPDDQDSLGVGGSMTPIAPLYVHTSSKTAVFNAGTNTGTIKEFIWSRSTDPLTGGTVRVVLTTPIVKNAADSLTIEHRLHWYPDVNDYTGVIDISGTSYDYVIRHSKINTAYQYHPAQITASSSVAFQTHSVCTGALAAITSYPSGWFGDITPSFGYGSASVDSAYANVTLYAGVDSCNGTITSVGDGWLGKFFQNLGVQFSLVETADGTTPITKLNTHALWLNYRSYVNRYVP